MMGKRMCNTHAQRERGRIDMTDAGSRVTYAACKRAPIVYRRIYIVSALGVLMGGGMKDIGLPQKGAQGGGGGRIDIFNGW